MTHTQLPKGLRGVLFDMDGVIYRGNVLLPGARELLDWLRLHEIPFGFVTNNSLLSPAEYAKKLRTLGAARTLDSLVVTSGEALARFLSSGKSNGAIRVLALGGDGLLGPLRNAGLSLVEDPEQADVVAIGLDLAFSYDRLRGACLAIRNGARFVAANVDVTWPLEDNILWPGTGCIAAAIEAGTGQKPTVIGKPQPTMIRMACNNLGIRPSKTMLVGDRLETDILAGNRAGSFTTLVLTGVTDRSTASTARIRPKLVVQNLVELKQWLLDEGSRDDTNFGRFAP